MHTRPFAKGSKAHCAQRLIARLVQRAMVRAMLPGPGAVVRKPGLGRAVLAPLCGRDSECRQGTVARWRYLLAPTDSGVIWQAVSLVLVR